MNTEFEHYVTMVAIGVAAVTPVARALMKFAHFCQGVALKSASKSDDVWAMRFVVATESVCGFLAKVTRFIPRLTVRGIDRP